jgi:hypothetical protein
MSDRSRQPGQGGTEASTYYDTGPLIPYYGPDGQVAYHPAPAGYLAPPEPAYAAPAAPEEDGWQGPDPGWAALREAVWESGGSQASPWSVRPPTSGNHWATEARSDDAGAEPQPSPVPTEAEPAPAPHPTAAHKVVPRPTAAHRISTGRPAAPGGVRASRVPYRVGAARRIRAGFTLILISVVLAGVASAVLLAVIAGIASAISHAASP